MRRRRRGNNYKFTKKKHSKRGIAALLLAFVSFGLGIAMVVISYRSGGAGGVYLGSVGILSMILALLSLVIGISSLREEGSYKTFPVAGTTLGLLALAGWAAVYIAGIFIS